MELSDDEIQEYVQQGGKLTAIGNKIYVMFNVNNDDIVVDDGNPDENSLIYEKIHDLYDCLMNEIKWNGLPLMDKSSLFNFEEFLKEQRKNNN